MYDSDFYNNLKKPALLPEGKVFKIIWLILYFLMFLSICIIIISDNDKKFLAITAFAVQLGLNILWPIVFFKYKNIELALVISILLMLAIAVMIIIFFDILKITGILQAPYFLWSCFAIYLNGSILALNKK